MSETWARWQGEVINGVFPLRHYLGGSDHSGVFLTEFKALNLPNAALKLVPALPTLTEAQLSHWTTAAALSHPHLIRLLEAGRCQLGALPFLYIVMEYAEQTLAQILPQRALTPDETREMLRPILNALGFLHGQHLVQGQLKPANILVVGDQLKLASDTIRPAGESAPSIAQASVYDPPEARDGSFSHAGDTWSLGITVIEALTQYPPAWPDRRFDAAALTATLPPRFAKIVRQCLDPEPTSRPTAAALEVELNLVPPAPTASAPPPIAPAPQPSASYSEPPMRATPSMDALLRETPNRRGLVIAIVAVVAISLVVWAGLRNTHTDRNAEVSRSAPPEVSAPAASTEPAGPASAELQTPPQRPAPAPPAKAVPPLASDSSSVLHEEIPDIPRSALNTIHGRIKIAVRVTIDGSGRVIRTDLEIPGPSKYFARHAIDAARKWTFSPTNGRDSQTRLLRFELTREGVTGRAESPR